MNLTNNEFALLGLVSERPKHGYEIEQDIEQRGMREWTEIGFSSIYYLLNKLEKAGLLSVEVQNTDEGHTRKVYHLTRSGEQNYLHAVRERLSNPRPHSGDFDLALANLEALPSSERLACLLIYRANLKKRLQTVQEKWREQDHGHLPISAEAIFDYSVASIQAEMNWVSTFIQRLEIRTPHIPLKTDLE